MARKIRTWAHVVVVAPEREQSATSHSLTLHRPLRIRKVSGAVYAVDGTPTDCITLAVHQILDERPDMVISGINSSANVGDDVHYSGTVSAAMEGAIIGISSVAISLAAFGDGQRHYNTAADVALKFCKKLHRAAAPKGSLFNINVPNVTPRRLSGLAVTRLGKRSYGGIIVEKTDPRGKLYYWIGGDQTGFEKRSGTDCVAIQDNKVSITPLKTDLSDRSYGKKMRQWI